MIGGSSAPASVRAVDPGPLLAWADERLRELGLTVTGTGPVRARHWSLTVRLDTCPAGAGRQTHASRGTTTSATPALTIAWAKADAAGSAHEAAVLGMLTPPGRPPLTTAAVAPLAVDPDRGWLLLPHAGDRPATTDEGGALEEWADPGLPPGTLGRLLADAQAAAVPLVPRLVAAGVPDHRPAALPTVAAALLAGPDPPAPDLLAVLDEHVGVLVAWCAELATSPLPATLVHGDEHHGNVATGIGSAHGPRLLDWGDSSVAHPFATTWLLSDAERAAYLHHAAAPLPPARLEREVRLAAAAALVGRADTWQRTTREGREEFAGPVREDWELLVEALRTVR